MALKQWGLGLKIFYISKIKLSYKNYSKKALLLCPKTSVKGVAAGPVKKALRQSCEKTVRCSTPLKSNKNYQAV
jgi:hypothetical protein